jgi:hypothetical protein
MIGVYDIGRTTPFTVYYIVGLPRTGSTFVGDWIARRLGIVNAGEVWQTLRTMDRVTSGGNVGFWGLPENKASKAMAISTNSFWSDVLARPELDPYAALLAVVGQQWNAMVDCSKTDRGIAHYRALGCRVVVIHTVRAFTAWQASVVKYNQKYALPVPSRMRLALRYLKLNRRYCTLRRAMTYQVVPQELLAHVAEILEFSSGSGISKNYYRNAEMFGSPGYNGSLDPSRITQCITIYDHALYIMINVHISTILNKASGINVFHGSD